MNPKEEAEVSLREIQLNDILPSSGKVRVLEQGDKDKKSRKLEIQFIEAGWSKNGYYYSKEVAESIANLVEKQNRRKMFMDHNMSWFGGGRSLKEWAATIESVSSKNGIATGVAKMTNNPNTSWLYEEAMEHPDEVGASIDARAKVEEVEEPEDSQGINRYVVKEIVFLNSIDFVTYAGAKGKVLDIAASENSFTNGPQAFANAIAQPLVEQIKTIIGNSEYGQKSHSPKKDDESPAKTSTVEEDDKPKPKTNNTMDPKEITKDVLVTQHPNIVKQLREEFQQETEQVTKAKRLQELEDLTVTDTERIAGLEKDLATAQESVNTLTAERDGLKTKVDQFEVAQKATEKANMVERLCKEAELEDEFISETFRADLMRLDKEDDIKERIQDRLEIVTKVAPQGTVRGNGPRPVKETDTTPAPTFDESKLVNEIVGG